MLIRRNVRANLLPVVSTARCAVMLLAILGQLFALACGYSQPGRELQEEIPASGNFLWLSDLHFDPFYGTSNATSEATAACQESSAPKYGQLGCDTPWALLDAALGMLQNTNNFSTYDIFSVDFAIVTGDICRHANDQLPNPIPDTRAILTNVSETLRQRLGPDVSIIPAVGNNDVTPDYYLDLENPEEILGMVAKGMDSLLESDQERASFRQGGYLERQVTSTITVLSLNTLAYATNHMPDQSHLEDPLNQFEWLEDRLQYAQKSNSSVFIIGHIPPAMGSYRHSQLWHEKYLLSYYQILSNFPGTVKGQCFGHLHSDEVRFVGSQWPILLAPSLTPIYGSNPSIRWVSYSPATGDVIDYETLYLKLLHPNAEDFIPADDWTRGPSLLESYDLQDLTTASWNAWLQDLKDHIGDHDNTHWSALVSRQHVHVEDKSTSCLDLQCRINWICTITTLDMKEYTNCVERGGEQHRTGSSLVLLSKVKIIALPVILIIGITIGILGWACMKYLRRWHYHKPTPDSHDTSAHDTLPEIS